MKQRLFIVEDEPDLAALIADYARAEGYAVDLFSDGATALQALRQTPPHLLILDLMLPALDGLSLCRQLREFSDLPVIMVTARVEEIDRLLGLESGADDYLCKPFSPRELMARVRAILRRTQSREQAGAPEWQIEEENRQLRWQGKALELGLTRTEFRLLAALMQRPGQIFSRTQLLDCIVPEGFDSSDRSIDSHIKNLRRKLQRAVPEANPIHAVYGVGYRFEF